MPVILFVCTANLFRSPIAAAYTERKLCAAGQPEAWTVGSAGTWTDAGLPAHPAALKAAAAFGLDLSAHRSREADVALLNASDLIVVMEQGHKEALENEFPACRGRIALLGELAGEGDPEIPDPVKTDFEESDATVQMIVTCIDKGFAELLRRAAIPRGAGQSQRSNTAMDSHENT
jgi:protein-tyrosine-phosphatase